MEIFAFNEGQRSNFTSPPPLSPLGRHSPPILHLIFIISIILPSSLHRRTTNPTTQKELLSIIQALEFKSLGGTNQGKETSWIIGELS